jgi:hypothetical protein
MPHGKTGPAVAAGATLTMIVMGGGGSWTFDRHPTVLRRTRLGVLARNL